MDSNIDRRDLLKMGAAAVAGATVMRGAEKEGYIGPARPDNAPKRGALAEAMAALGNYVLLAPMKFGGGAYAMDLATGRTLAWIQYWNYGDTNPISHHLAAFPSEDPYSGFEFVNSTQGGKNLYVYGLPTKVKDPGAGFNIYRVRYDGLQMNLMENISETTGLGLGVHVTIAPEATSFGVADGQKDIAAIFDRQSSRVLACFQFNWEPNNKDLRRAWLDGGRLTIQRIYPDHTSGRFDFEGLKGVKTDWEIVPGGELFIEDGKTPGPSPHTVAGSDPWLFDPRGRYAIVGIRLAGIGLVMDRKNNYAPVAALYGPKGGPDQYPIDSLGNDSWVITIDKVLSPVHEAGFSPDGNTFVFMNTTRQNNVAVFDTRNNDDPKAWKKVTYIEHPDWRGTYPNPFHLMFTPDGKKVYASIWYPPSSRSSLAIIDAENWKIHKIIEGVGKDMQTLCMTYDGNYLMAVFSGAQKYESGIFVLDARTDEPYGYLPSPAGHHDCVIVPRTLEDLRVSRSTTV